MALDAHYQSSLVTQRLFDSYLYQGRALVQNTKGEGDAVQEAIDWYLTALTLQPQHQRALYEIALAQRYLEGRRLLAQPKRPQEQGKNEDNSLSQAVALLQWVYQQEPDYAGGTVAAILKAATEAEHPAEPQISGDIVVPAEDETSFEEQRRLHLQQADEAMAAENYTLAVEHYQQAADVAIHGGYDSAKWLFAAYVKIGTAYTAQHEDELAILAFQTAIAVMQASGTAIPEEDYAPYVQEGDLLAQDLDFAAALEPYAQALQVMSAKCDCGLEEWSILR